jgi:hypothetical protein
MDQPPPGFNSTKGVGGTYPDFKESIVLPSGKEGGRERQGLRDSTREDRDLREGQA